MVACSRSGESNGSGVGGEDAAVATEAIGAPAASDEDPSLNEEAQQLLTLETMMRLGLNPLVSLGLAPSSAFGSELATPPLRAMGVAAAAAAVGGTAGGGRERRFVFLSPRVRPEMCAGATHSRATTFMQMVAGQQEGLRALQHEILKEQRTRDDVQENENAVAAAAPSANATTANAALLEAAESDTHAALAGQGQPSHYFWDVSMPSPLVTGPTAPAFEGDVASLEPCVDSSSGGR